MPREIQRQPNASQRALGTFGFVPFNVGKEPVVDDIASPFTWRVRVSSAILDAAGGAR